MQNKILEIIIPRFKESEYLSYNLFASINFQINIDFRLLRITLVQDGNGIDLSPEYLAQFKNLEINYYKLNKNVGPGLVRQFGIDNSSSNYILFIDQDDTLFSCRSLQDIFICIMQNEKSDIICTKWYEQKNGNLIDMESQATWLHGTIFKREFLIRNNIRFHSELRVSEDSYFISLALMICNYLKTGEVIKMTSPELRSIVWRDNPKSTVRSVYKIDEVLLWHIKSMNFLCEECVKRNIGISRKVVSVLYYIAFSVLSFRVNFKDKTNLIAQEIKKEMVLFYSKYKNEYNKLDRVQKNEIFLENKKKHLERLNKSFGRFIINKNIKDLEKIFTTTYNI